MRTPSQGERPDREKQDQPTSLQAPNDGSRLRARSELELQRGARA